MDKELREKLKSVCEREYNQYNDAVGLAFKKLAAQAMEPGADIGAILDEYLADIAISSDNLAKRYVAVSSDRDDILLCELRSILDENALSLAQKILSLTNDYLNEKPMN